MSLPKWWGDWRQNLTPHTGDLQPTDLIECTQIVGGQPVNTVITGAQILGAVPTPSVAWGSITGTLSSQTDLQTALNAKQDTLVSGTNIKTINGSSILGSGNLTISGSNIYTADGTLTAARTLTQGGFDLTIAGTTSSRFFSNGNVGIGTTTDAGFKLNVNGTARVQGTFTSTAGFKVNQFSLQPLTPTNIVLGFNTFYNGSQFIYDSAGTAGYIQYFNNEFAFKTAATGSANANLSSVSNVATLNSSSLSLNGSLNISNSAHTFSTANVRLRFGSAIGSVSNNMRIDYFSGGFSHYIVPIMDNANNDNNNLSIYLNNSTTSGGSSAPATGNRLAIRFGALTNTSYRPTLIQDTTTLNTTPNSSAILEAVSTTQGFLPPRMTTTQKNAIASPAAGLVVYDTTLNKLCIRTASAWETITSL